MNKLKNIDFKSIQNKIAKYTKTNEFYLIFLVINIFNDLLLRIMTLNNLKTVIQLQPIFSSLFFILLLGGFSYLFKKAKSRMIYLSVLTVFFTALCVINSIYYNFYSSFASISLLSNLKFAAQMDASVTTNVIKLKDFICIIPLIIYFFLLKKYKDKKHFKNTTRKDYRIKTFIRNLYLTGSSLILLLITLRPVDYSRLVKQWNREYLVGRFGIYTYHANDIIKSLEPKLVSFFGYDNAYKNFNEYFKNTPDNQKHTNKYTGIHKGKNIISIHGESIQNFLIGLKFNGVEVTPNLNKLTKESMYFDNFYTQVSVGTSSDSEFTLNTSLMPTNVGTAFVSYFNRSYNAIPNILKKEGYRTLSFHANTGSFWNRNAMYKSLGYDRFYSKDSYNIDEVLGLGLTDESFFKQTVPILKAEHDKYGKFYATLIMLSNHTPFFDVSKYTTIDLSKTKKIIDNNGNEILKKYPYLEETKLGAYIKSAHYADYTIGILMEELEKAGLLDNTVIMFYGDHDARISRNDYNLMYNFDESTNDNEYLTENDPKYREFNKYDYELNRKVPFFLWTKDKKHVLKNSNIMGMYNVQATLGNMFGFYNKYSLGKDIFEIKNKNVVPFHSGSWIDNNIYYDYQSGMQYAIKQTPISPEYINKTNEEVNALLKVSNNMIIYNLLNNIDKNKINEITIIKEAHEK